ncbi:MAG TPA: inorganic phosphate transporter [Candidatus Tectomicrobia bacterium]|jgi:PiT family inorganic phosphate transporter
MHATADLTGILALLHAPLTVLALIFVALAFDFINGFHDAANSIATVVSTRVLTPRIAVYWAAAFNFLAVFVFGTAVAKTIGKGIINLAVIDYSIVLATMAGAILWNLITWYYGLPSSSSHALVGGLVGAGMAKAGLGALEWSGISKTLVFIVVSPVLGLLLGFLYMVLLAWIFHRSTPRYVDRLFRKGQLLSAALYSLGHGGNDAQKTAGIIFGILAAGNMVGNQDHIPFWVLLLCHIAMGLGTAFGGWRIVKTMGMKITKLKPVGGFAAETAGATTLGLNAIFGIPASTTHVITGAIVGVGSTTKLSAVRWGVAGRIVWAWVLTIPAAASTAIAAWYLLHAFGIA